MKYPAKIMYRAHFIWCSLWTAITTAICSTGFAAASIFSRTPAQFHRWGGWWGGWTLGMAGIRVRTELRGSIDPVRKYVFVANHQNSIDIPAMLVSIPVPFGFVAKASLEKMPFLGWALRLSPSVFVDTADARRSRESMILAAQRIAAGSSVLVFPEGRRTWSSQMVPFKRSAFTLAAEAGISVVPVAILNAHTLFDERNYLSRPGTVRVVIGDPIKPTGTERSDVDELSREAHNRIMSLIKQNSEPQPVIGGTLRQASINKSPSR